MSPGKIPQAGNNWMNEHGKIENHHERIDETLRQKIVPEPSSFRKRHHKNLVDDVPEGAPLRSNHHKMEGK